MRILYFADPNSIHDQKWISYFTKGSFDVYLIPLERHWNTKFTKQHDLGKILNPIPDFSIVRFLRTLCTAVRIRKIILKFKIETIHILYAEPNALWCLFRIYFGIPMVISTRGTDVLKTIPETFLRKTAINWLVSLAYKNAFLRADAITSTSHSQEKSINSFSGRLKGIYIVRTGVELDKIIDNRESFSVLSKQIQYILFPRYIRPVYNHEFSLQAIRMLAPEIKSKYSMVFVGKNCGDHQYQNKLQDIMSTIRNVNFIFLEKQSQEALFELYKNAALVVMTPLTDGSPVSAMEVLISGSKLILGPAGYDQDIFSGVETLEEWNTVELTDKMTLLLSQPYKTQVSANAMRLLSRDYNMSLMKSIYLDLVKSK